MTSKPTPENEVGAILCAIDDGKTSLAKHLIVQAFARLPTPPLLTGEIEKALAAFAEGAKGSAVDGCKAGFILAAAYRAKVEELAKAKAKDELESITPDQGREISLDEAIAAHTTWARAKESASLLALERAEKAEASLRDLLNRQTEADRILNKMIGWAELLHEYDGTSSALLEDITTAKKIWNTSRQTGEKR